MNPRVWLAVIGGAAALDIWADRNDREGDSLSEATRALFRTNTRGGRFTFTVALFGVVVWFYDHILNDPAREGE